MTTSVLFVLLWKRVLSSMKGIAAAKSDAIALLEKMPFIGM